MKRITLVAGVAFFMMETMAASCASTSVSLGSGTPKHPAVDDIAIASSTVQPAPLNFPEAKGAITNHSSGTSDYSFTISFVSDAGTVVAQGSLRTVWPRASRPPSRSPAALTSRCRRCNASP